MALFVANWEKCASLVAAPKRLGAGGAVKQVVINAFFIQSVTLEKDEGEGG